MILRFRKKTPGVQVQVSRIRSLRRWGTGVPRPRGTSLPNTPQIPDPPPTTWAFITRNPTAPLESEEDVFGYEPGFAETFYDAWSREQREPWESDPDAWKQ